MARRESKAGDCLCDVTGADRTDGELVWFGDMIGSS
jgi:hypothetical protein